MNRLLVTILVSLAAGCATVSVKKVETGTQGVGDRMQLTLDGPWNHIDSSRMGPAQTWTMEGLPIDQLLVYSGIKNEQLVHAESGGGRKSFAFRSAMQPDEIVAMFEGMLTRDGSTFKLVKLEPAAFGGEKGFRFEYSLIRKGDNVQLSGLCYGAISKGELFAVLYLAPRLGFYPRHQPRVEQIARSARIKS